MTVEWITRMATKGQDRAGLVIHHVTKNGSQFKTYEFFVSGIFRLTHTDNVMV